MSFNRRYGNNHAHYQLRDDIEACGAAIRKQLEVEAQIRSYYKPVKKDCQGCGAPSSVTHSCEYCGRAS